MTGHELPLTAVLRAPLRVAVEGLPGVGAGAVGAALSAVDGVDVVPTGPDICVRVVAEVVKPEDRLAITAAGVPVLVVHTKADLCHFGPGGPVEVARRRCTRLARLTGVPAEPMVGLLAVAALDPDVLTEPLVEALRILADEPADLRSAEAFVTAPHRVPAADRQRLVEALDLFGIAHAVLTVRRAPGLRAVRAVLRRVSGVDAVAARIELLGAEVRYRRLLTALAEADLAALTDPAIAEWLNGDDVVLMRMTVALEVMRAAGVPVEPDAAPLEQALRWRRYGAGPVAATHRACAADITRGALRSWEATR